MLPGKKILSVVVGAAMLSMPAGALAGYYDGGASARPFVKQERADVDGYRAARATPFQVADEDDWHHNGHDRDHHDENWYRHHNRYRNGRPFNNNDYNWGGRNRYDHPYSYYANPNYPPAWSGWNGSQRHGYLVQRRDAAIRLQRQMRAKGDKDAADRLGTAIQELNRRIARGG